MGSFSSELSRYLYWLLEGVEAMQTIYSGQTLARNIVATAPEGATRVISAGTLTCRPALSVKVTVSPVSGAFFASPPPQPVKSENVRMTIRNMAQMRFIAHLLSDHRG